MATDWWAVVRLRPAASCVLTRASMCWGRRSTSDMLLAAERVGRGVEQGKIDWPGRALGTRREGDHVPRSVSRAA
ncbi:hypothetical protein [Streptomyces sp. NPDC057494]|uniref:hypothetical protein n=1 Tax=Streptomyces sp. NPDC057494 TaxID=3346148 RepID=UPI0036B32853